MFMSWSMSFFRPREDLFLCPQSAEAGLLAAGSALEATAQVCKGEVQSV